MNFMSDDDRTELRMLQRNRLDPAETESGFDEISFADIARMLHRSRWLIAVVVFAVVGLVALYTVLTRPEYESEATVQVFVERAARFGAMAELGAAIGLPDLARSEAGRIGTDVLVMQSRRIIEPVVDSLKLQVRLLRPRVPRVSILAAIDVPREVIPARVDLRYRGNGVYGVRAETDWDVPLSHSDYAEIGSPFAVGNVTLMLDPELRDEPPGRITFLIATFRGAVEAVRANLEIDLAEAGTQIIQVDYRDADPILAAAVPNVITDGFIRYRKETSRTESRSRAKFLRAQVANYTGTLERAEERLQAFREREQIISPEDQASEQVRYLAELMNRRDALQQEGDALRRLLARVRSGGAEEEDTRETYRQLAAFPVFFGNSVVQDILRSLIELENERASLLIRRTEESIDVRGIDSRIAELEFQLVEISESYLESRDNQIASLDATLSRFVDQLEQVPAREVEFARLRRDQELLSEIYGQLRTRLHEVEVEEAVEPLDVQLLDPGLVPLEPASPRPLLNLALALFAGMILGLLAALGRHIVDTKVHSTNDVRLASGGLPVMATIPRISLAAQGRDNGKLPLRRIARRRPRLPPASHLVTRDAPRSPAAEAYRALRTRVFLRRHNDAPRVLVVTSAETGEGKSTSAANLAVTLGHQGVPTLLIDGDLRSGIVHEIFGIERQPGLSDVLRKEIAVDEAIRSLPVAEGGLDILPSGEHPNNPSELIGSEQMQLLLETLLDRYDRVLIDSPPLRFATDAAILCSMPSASALLVTRAGYSDRHALEQVAQELHEMGISFDGVIVNDVAPGEAPAYGYHAS